MKWQKKNKEGYKEIQLLTCSKLCRQLPNVGLTLINDEIPFFRVLCQSSFLSLVFGFVLFLDVSFLCRINLDNYVLLVFCVDLLKTKFTISLSEFWVDHRFLLLEMNIFCFISNFLSNYLHQYIYIYKLVKRSHIIACGWWLSVSRSCGFFVFNCISNVHWLSKAKTIFVEEQQWDNFTYNCEQ